MPNAHQLKPMTSRTAKESLALASTHYENFPVASVFLPRNLRKPISLIYSFARQADDFADEGDLSIENRLSLLNGFSDELDLLRAYIKPQTPFFMALGEMIKHNHLPYTPFYDLLSAFKQDTVKTRYADFKEIADYCARSANPIGRLLLHLYGQSTSKNVEFSDNICTALQLINFLQDIGLDLKKNEGQQRIYMCQNELRIFNITEQHLLLFAFQTQAVNENWQHFMQFNLKRASRLLQAGKPLGSMLTGRVGFEMRLIIAGGERIIYKIEKVKGDIFKYRPILTKWDWIVIFLKALFKK